MYNLSVAPGLFPIQINLLGKPYQCVLISGNISANVDYIVNASGLISRNMLATVSYTVNSSGLIDQSRLYQQEN